MSPTPRAVHRAQWKIQPHEGSKPQGTTTEEERKVSWDRANLRTKLTTNKNVSIMPRLPPVPKSGKAMMKQKFKPNFIEAAEIPGQEEWRTLWLRNYKNEGGLKGGNSFGKPENPWERGSHMGHTELLLPTPLLLLLLPLGVSRIANSIGLELRKNQCIPSRHCATVTPYWLLCGSSDVDR